MWENPGKTQHPPCRFVGCKSDPGSAEPTAPVHWLYWNLVSARGRPSKPNLTTQLLCAIRTYVVLRSTPDPKP